MRIVGSDLHTPYGQMAMLDQETGELIERRLGDENGEGTLRGAGFYRSVILVYCRAVGLPFFSL